MNIDNEFMAKVIKLSLIEIAMNQHIFTIVEPYLIDWSISSKSFITNTFAIMDK